MARGAVITGASSGIGRALALELAARGWDVAITARREAALEELAATIRQRHPERRVVVRACDVVAIDTLPDAMRDIFAALGDVGLVVVNAGVGGPDRVGKGKFDGARQIITTNLLGAMATADAAIGCWRASTGTGSRKLVGITSVAAFRGLPGGAAYSASKAGFAVWLEGIRHEVRRFGIDVIDIAPGFIDTPINQDRATRPFLIDATDGARRIADLIDRGVYHSTVPVWPWNAIGWLMRRIPHGLWARIGDPGRDA